MTALIPYRLYPRLDRTRGIIWTGGYNLVGRPMWVSVKLLCDRSDLRLVPWLFDRRIDQVFDERGYLRFRQPVTDRSRSTRRFERFLRITDPHEHPLP